MLALRKYSFFFIWTVFSLSAYTQVSVKLNILADTLETEKYIPSSLKGKARLTLRTKPGSNKIINPDDAKKLRGAKIERVELLYTDYPKGADMSLLNKKRILSLYLIAPELFNNPVITWTFVKQTEATSQNIYNFLHGFVITYEPGKEENVLYTKQYLRDILSGKIAPQDSTILKVFSRNNWDNMVIVCDFTGSMSPYVAQLLLWYQLNFDEKKNQAFVFFNDGNDTRDSQKKIGKTGGIYINREKNIDSVLNTAIQTIEKGSGGDGPENDVEALIKAIDLFPEKDHIVLIADNWSTMRDYHLIKKIDRPVKVILCGAEKRINSEYLDLAYQTGGSVHSIEQDIKNLIKLKEGQTITIGETHFIIKNGLFQESH